MLTLSSYVKKVLNEADEPELEAPEGDKPEVGAEKPETAEKPEAAEKPEPSNKKECDTILTVECCGPALKKIIDAIKKTSGNFKIEIDTGDEESEKKIEFVSSLSSTD